MFKNTDCVLDWEIVLYLQVFSLCDIQRKCEVKMAGTSQPKKEPLCFSFTALHWPPHPFASHILRHA